MKFSLLRTNEKRRKDSNLDWKWAMFWSAIRSVELPSNSHAYAFQWNKCRISDANMKGGRGGEGIRNRNKSDACL